MIQKYRIRQYSQKRVRVVRTLSKIERFSRTFNCFKTIVSDASIVAVVSRKNFTLTTTFPNIHQFSIHLRINKKPGVRSPLVLVVLVLGSFLHKLEIFKIRNIVFQHVSFFNLFYVVPPFYIFYRNPEF